MILQTHRWLGIAYTIYGQVCIVCMPFIVVMYTFIVE